MDEQADRSTDPTSSADSESIRLADLYFDPDDSDEYDVAACKALVAKFVQAGAKTCDDVAGLLVSLDDFFTGNRNRYSIAANRVLPEPLDTAEGWADFLRQIEARDDVAGVFVQISTIEPYEGGQLGQWPYADTVWVDTSLERAAVAELMAPLDPDEVKEPTSEALVKYHDCTLRIPDGIRRYFVWWD